MMEPGEAPRLFAILGGSVGDAGPANQAPDAVFVRWLLGHEIFVAAEKATGLVVGFAAARPSTELYWLSALLVDPAFRRRGIGDALMTAVLARAGWFGHRAMGCEPLTESDLEEFHDVKAGFVTVCRDDLAEKLQFEPLQAAPFWKRDPVCPMAVHWL